MALGVMQVPAIVLRLDDMATAPAWVWIGFLGWLGIYILYPAWAIWLGIIETRLARPARLRAAPAISDRAGGSLISRLPARSRVGAALYTYWP